LSYRRGSVEPLVDVDLDRLCLVLAVLVVARNDRRLKTATAGWPSNHRVVSRPKSAITTA